MFRTLALLTLGLAPLAAAHCKVTAATGSAGGSSAGMGITAGSGNSESDVTVYRGNNGFGRTESSGAINPAAAAPAAMKLASSSTPPQVAAGGSVSMTMHVVNADGAGPMKCYVSQDATGADWTEMQVMQNVPGAGGLNLVNNKDYKMQVQMPAGAQCSGQVAGMSSMCMVKCQNPIGPFGGTVPVQMVSGQGQKRDATGADADEEFGYLHEHLAAATNATQPAGRPAAVRSILNA